MAQQWQTLTHLCKKNKSLHEKVNELYRQSCFPYKIRSYFAVWIEGKDWNSYDVTTPDGKRKIEELYRELLTMLDTTEEEMQASQSYDLEKTLDFTRAKHAIKNEFETNLGKFVDELKRCLEEERNLMVSCENDEELKRKTNKPNDYATENLEIKQKLAALDQQISAAEKAVSELEKQQDDFSGAYRKFTEQISGIEQRLLTSQTQTSKDELLSRKKNFENLREQRAVANLEGRNAMADKHINLATDLAYILQAIWAEIKKWHAESKLAMVGLLQMKRGMLDVLDKMCEHGGQLLYQMIQQVENALTLFRKVNYPDDRKKQQMEMVLKELSEDYLPMFLQKAFIIEQNIPDRLLRVSSGRSTNFSISVRILGGKALGLSFSKPKVKISLFAERDIPPGEKYTPGICEIGNGDEKVFVIHHTNNACVAQFHSVQLKNIRRPDRGRNDELVTDQKFAFVFYTSINICGRSIALKSVSLPVILLSQTSQEIMARGTLVWDAAFSEENRVPFACRESVLWSEVANVLSTLFYHTGGRPLAPEHLNYLAKMAFKENGDLDFNNMSITERQIIRERLPQREFSFWKWFWACLNLVKDRVQAEWRDGLIYGFISREDVKKKLWDQPCGTFLLRFSETGIENSQRSDVSGYLTLAVMETDPSTKQKKLFHVREYLSPREILERGLPQILDAMEVADEKNRNIKRPLLRYLWPDSNRTFDEVFGPRIVKRVVGDDGYRQAKFAIEIILDEDTSRRNRYDVNSDATSNIASPSTLNPLSPTSQFSPLSYNDNIDDFMPDDSSQDRHPQNIQLQVKPTAAVFPQAQGNDGQHALYPQSMLNGGPQSHMFTQFHHSLFGGSGIEGTVGGSYGGGLENEFQHITSSGTNNWSEDLMASQLEMVDLDIDADSILTTDSDGDIVVRTS